MTARDPGKSANAGVDRPEIDYDYYHEEAKKARHAAIVAFHVVLARWVARASAQIFSTWRHFHATSLRHAPRHQNLRPENARRA